MGRLGLTGIAPAVSCGRYPACAVIGEQVPISATIVREGHDAVAANVVWTGPDKAKSPFNRMQPGTPGTDRWHATVVPTGQGMWTFAIEAWSDPVSTWRHVVEVKLEAGQGAADLANDIEDGARLLDRAARTAPKDRRAELAAAANALRDTNSDLAHRLAPALTPALRALLDDDPLGDLRSRADKAIVLDDHRTGLERLEHSADPRTPGDVDVAADLGAAADGRPGVDHRALTDARAEIDEAWHQHRARRDKGALADDRAGDRAKPRRFIFGSPPAMKFGIDLVPPAAATGPTGDDAHRIEPERQ